MWILRSEAVRVPGPVECPDRTPGPAGSRVAVAVRVIGRRCPVLCPTVACGGWHAIGGSGVTPTCAVAPITIGPHRSAPRIPFRILIRLRRRMTYQPVAPCGRSARRLREAHVSTQQPSPCEEARVPSSDEHARRTGRAQVATRQGPSQAVRLIWRIRERGEFQRLQDDGRRLRSGALWCTYVLDHLCNPPRIAFAIGRASGPAVVRNRIRRRLRHLLAMADLPGGLYLFGARPAAARRSFHELESDLGALLKGVPSSQSSSVPRRDGPRPDGTALAVSATDGRSG